MSYSTFRYKDCKFFDINNLVVLYFTEALLTVTSAFTVATKAKTTTKDFMIFVLFSGGGAAALISSENLRWLGTKRFGAFILGIISRKKIFESIFKCILAIDLKSISG